MNKRIFRADILLLITAAVWGFGFVAQRSGMLYVGPFTFNSIRFFLGSLSLLPLIVWRNSRSNEKKGEARNDWSNKKTLLFSSFLAGTCLFLGVSLQQIGIMFTTAGNAGFITGLYVIFTPIFGIFLGRRTGRATWLGAILTLTGLYFLSSSGESDNINPGDVIVAVGAVFWSFHVLIIDRLVKKTDPIALSSGQFFFASLYALIAAFLAEPFLSQWLGSQESGIFSSGFTGWKSFPALLSGLAAGTVPISFISDALIPILYGAFGSVGIGYTLQAIAQKEAPPTHTTIILCLEGCFAALGGILLLYEPMRARILFGFALMLSGMLVSQWELIGSRRQNGSKKTD